MSTAEKPEHLIPCTPEQAKAYNLPLERTKAPKYEYSDLVKPEQPIPVTKLKKNYLSKKSRKPRAIQNAVIARKALGQSTNKISKDLKIARNTVTSIVELSNIEQLMDSGELQAFQMMHKSLNVLDNRLDKGSESAATYLLSNTLFSDKYSKKQAPPADMVVNLAIQNLIQAPESTATEVHKPTQVIDNKQLD